MQIFTVVIKHDRFYGGFEAYNGPTLREAMDQAIKGMMHLMRNEGIREPFTWCLNIYDNPDQNCTFVEFGEKVRLFYGEDTGVYAFMNSILI